MKPLLLTLLIFTQMSQADNYITIYSGNQHGHLSQDEIQNIYNISGFAVVKQSKKSLFRSGTFTLSFNDVAAHIDPTTVSLDIPDNPDAIEILDQNFQFDLVSSDKLLEKYIDQLITVHHSQGTENITTAGKLLSTAGGLTLAVTDNQITTIKSWDQIEFPELPGGLLTKPTLVWLLDSKTDKNETIQLAYQTKGMTWWSDYIISLKETSKGCFLDLTSWVTIVNKSGASFPNTSLKLIAGDVNRSQPQRMQTMVRNSLSKAANNEFNEQALFEYHLYKLPRKIDLPDNSTKQIKLIANTQDIKCENILIFNGSQQSQLNYHRPITDRNYLAKSNAKVEAFLHFENSNNNQLGLPLPAGRVRVNTIDTSDNTLEFIGEDNIDHTAKNSTVKLKLGHSFDVNASRKQTNFELMKTSLKEQFEIVVNNQKSVDQTVDIIEPLYRWSNWQLTEHNSEYEKINTSTIKFQLKVPANSERSIRYTVMYQWPNDIK